MKVQFLVPWHALYYYFLRAKTTAGALLCCLSAGQIQLWTLRAHSTMTPSSPEHKKQRTRYYYHRTRGAVRSEHEAAVFQIMAFTEDGGYVHWTDGLRLQGVCREMRSLWKPRCDAVIANRVLPALNKLNRANFCRSCERRGQGFPALLPGDQDEPVCDGRCGHDGDSNVALGHLDPRGDETFCNLSPLKQCQELFRFTKDLVTNFQSNFDYSRLTLGFLPDAFSDLHWEYEPYLFLVYEKERRLNFILNLMAADWGQSELYTDSGVYRFEEAFAGTGFDPNTGSSFGEGVRSGFDELLPATNERIGRVIHATRAKYEKTWQLLGPVLSRQLDFLAPFVDDNGRALLPTNEMEPMTKKDKAKMRALGHVDRKCVYW